MLAIERREEIIRIITRDKSVRVNELAERFEVTEETIRRDLDKLEKEGIVKKTYGGAVVRDFVSKDATLSERLQTNLDEKRRIAALARDLVNDGETIFIDMSTTALEFIKHIDEDKKVTVITNSLTAITELNNKPNVKVITIGGVLNSETLCMEGPMTHKFIQNYYVDKTIFSVKAISLDRGIMDSNEVSADIKRLMIRNANQAILLVDATKFDQTALTIVTDMENVDMLITEKNLDSDWQDAISSWDVELVIAK